MRWEYFTLKRQGLALNQPYVTEKMGVTASTIQRYEAGTIDNTKKPEAAVQRLTNLLSDNSKSV